eukprot:4975536-Pyramimonas_sp.AAC.2
MSSLTSVFAAINRGLTDDLHKVLSVTETAVRAMATSSKRMKVTPPLGLDKGTMRSIRSFHDV